MIVPAFPRTLLLSQWIATKAIPGKTGTNHIPVIGGVSKSRNFYSVFIFGESGIRVVGIGCLFVGLG